MGFIHIYLIGAILMVEKIWLAFEIFGPLSPHENASRGDNHGMGNDTKRKTQSIYCNEEI